jgi:hypothetical protein
MISTLEEILRTRTVCAQDGTKITLDYAITAVEGEKAPTVDRRQAADRES